LRRRRFYLWRGNFTCPTDTPPTCLTDTHLLFVARELAPAGVRSSPKTDHLGISGECQQPGAAAQPSGSKLPRHRVHGVTSVVNSPAMTFLDDWPPLYRLLCAVGSTML
jgi:hypothetical protein